MSENTKPSHIRIVSKLGEPCPTFNTPGASETRVLFVRYREDGTEDVDDISDRVHGVAFRHVAGGQTELTLTVYDAELELDGADQVTSAKATREVVQRYGQPQKAAAAMPRKIAPADAHKLAEMPEDVLATHLQAVGLNPPIAVQFTGDQGSDDVRASRRRLMFETWARTANVVAQDKAEQLAERLDSIEGGA